MEREESTASELSQLLNITAIIPSHFESQLLRRLDCKKTVRGQLTSTRFLVSLSVSNGKFGTDIDVWKILFN